MEERWWRTVSGQSTTIKDAFEQTTLQYSGSMMELYIPRFKN
ncbi:hypothetical protein RSAG8_10370, partial [Rhizoctonia solani AG-8 WAC10335]